LASFSGGSSAPQPPSRTASTKLHENHEGPGFSRFPERSGKYLLSGDMLGRFAPTILPIFEIPVPSENFQETIGPSAPRDGNPGTEAGGPFRGIRYCPELACHGGKGTWRPHQPVQASRLFRMLSSPFPPDRQQTPGKNNFSGQCMVGGRVWASLTANAGG